MINFYNFLKENRSQTSKEIINKFGEILFGDFRNKRESDTEYEQDVFDNLKLFIKGNKTGKHLDQEFLNQLKELQQLKQKYPDVLMPINDTQWFYRAITVGQSNKRELTDFINYQTKFTETDLMYGFDDDEQEPLIRTANPINYKSRSPVQSWTHRLDVASIFGNLILQSDLKDRNLLFNFDFLNQVDKKVDIDEPEYETMRISEKPVKSYILIPDAIYTTFMVKGILRNEIVLDDVLENYKEEVEKRLK